MQSIPAAHYCFSAEIITMKNNAGYWLRVVFFFLSPSFILYIRRLYSPPSSCFTVLFIQKVWQVVGCTKLTEQKTSRFITAIIYIVLKWECVVAEGGGKVFLIVPDINELRLVRGFTDLQVFREAAETWRAAGFDSVLYIYISNLLTSRLIILKSVYINSLRVTRVTVRLHFGWQCLQYPSHTG